MKKAGLVFHDQDIEQIKAVIKRLTLSSNERKQMGIEARKWAKEHDWDRVVERVYRLVKGVIRERYIWE